MSESTATIIKRYANRRFYDPAALTYVTLDDLAEMVERHQEFEVVDSETGADITRGVLKRIIFEQAGQ